ncbi:MAG: type II toxin-antitoxin system HicB family antitoxin [Acutalibacteraceae bacterium]
MNKYYYPAVFQKETDGFSVWLPDVPGCISQGDNLEEAVDNIKDAFGLFVEEEKANGATIPAASLPGDVKTEEGQFVALVEFDWAEYLRKNDTRTVKKTLTIPAWLNALAEEQHINFSGVLKSALIEKLHA